MKNIQIIFLLFLSTVFAQVSMSDINKLSNQQLDAIVVPVNPNPNDFDITAFISDLSTTLANIAAILLIVDNQNN